MTRYARGAVRERLLMLALQTDGWIVYRSAGSHGHADLVALRADVRPLLVQVKADIAGAFAHFGPAARWELCQEAEIAGALPVLAWAKPRGSVEWFLGPRWEPIESPPRVALAGALQ